jgi:hypothetical protein
MRTYPIVNQITPSLKNLENLDSRKLPEIKFVDISSKIEYFYYLQIDNLRHKTSISFFYDKYKLNITDFCEFWQFSLVHLAIFEKYSK